MTVRREYAAALIALVIGAALALLALGRPWLSATAGGGATPQVAVELTGRQLVPAAAGAAVLLLAGAAAVVATRGIGRIVVGALLVLAAGGVLAATGSWRAGADGSGPRAAADALGVGGLAAAEGLAAQGPAGTGGLGAQGLQVVIGPWWIGALVGGAIALLAAVVVCLRGRRWPGLGSRYDRSAATASAAAGSRAPTAAQAWDALDRGEDPTMAEDLTE